MNEHNYKISCCYYMCWYASMDIYKSRDHQFVSVKSLCQGSKVVGHSDDCFNGYKVPTLQQQLKNTLPNYLIFKSISVSDKVQFVMRFQQICEDLVVCRVFFCFPS